MSEEKLVGKKFDRYQIKSMLGRGLLATTYQAVDTTSNRVVVVKTYRRSFMEDAEFAGRFQNEMRDLSRLKHDGIVPLLDFGVAESQAYVALPYIAGGSLAALIAGYGALAPGEAASIVDQVAAALAYAHEHDILHRNLTAFNILMDEGSTAYVTDFSLPVIRDAAAALMDTPVGGAPSTMPPEVASGNSEATPASDVYSMGIIIFQALTGQLPYPSIDPIQQIMAHLNSPVPDVRSIKPTLDEQVAAVVRQAMEKDPKKRIATMSELVTVFNRAAGPSREPLQPLPPRRAPAAASDDPYKTGVIEPPHTPPTLPQLDQSDLPGFTTRQLTPPSMSVAPSDLVPASEPGKPKKARTRRAGWRIGGSGGVRWYAALLSILLLLIVWFAVGVIVGLEGRRQIGEAELAVIHQTQTPAAATWEAETTATLGAYLAGLATATQGAQVAATDTAVVLTPTATETPTPTVTPSPTPTPLAGGGGWIAYVAERDGDPDIFLIDADTGQQVRITDTEGVDDRPAWSPDGQKLAFEGDTPDGRHIFVLDIRCAEIHTDCVGDAQQLTTGTRRNQYPVWSPGGQQIMFISTDGTGRTWFRTVSLNGEEREVTQIVASNRLLAWTSDDELLFFGPGSDGVFDVFRLPVGAPVTEREAVTDGNGAIEFVNFSAGGGFAVYSQVVGNLRQLFLADGTCPLINECEITRLTEDRFSYFTPRLSPDGTRVLTAARREGNLDLYLMDLQGENLSRLTGEPYDEYNPVWQPSDQVVPGS